MSTGKAFANITNKSILGFADFSTRFLDYMKEKATETIRFQWDVDGAFNVPYGLSGPANDTVAVDGANYSTDGIGHLLNLGAAAVADVQVPFENEAAIVYQVGVKYAEIPSVIRINPKTGKPEYSRFTEVIGEDNDPTSVVDNGGSITFNVDSVTEAGVDNSGRRVLVYKKNLADGALNDSIAIEELVVAYGANNTVTTSGLLGQSTVSTASSDYTVVLLGLSVKRNTSIESASGYMYVGDVTGAGAGNPPVTFDTSNQRLIKTFQDASQVTFVPYLWLTATNVQSALQQVVDTLAASGAANEGATRVGVNANNFFRKQFAAVPDTDEDWGAFGNIADGVFNSNSSVGDVLTQLTDAMVRWRGWRTKGLAGTRTIDNTLDSIGNPQFYDGLWILRAPEDTVDENSGSPYEYGGLLDMRFAKFLAEHGGNGEPTNFQQIDVTGGDLTNIVGQYERVQFLSDGGLNRSLRAAHSFEVSYFGMDSGLFHGYPLPAAGGGPDRNSTATPVHLKNGVIKPISGPTPGDRDAVHFEQNALATGDGKFVFENLFIQAEPGFSALGLPDWTPSDGSSSVVFRNCTFKGANGGSPTNALVHDPNAFDAGSVPVVFENCKFIGQAGVDQKLVELDNFTPGHSVRFIGCDFYAPEGRAIDCSATVGGNISFTDCNVYCQGGTGAFSFLSVINCGNVDITNMKVVLDGNGSRDVLSSTPQIAIQGGARIRNMYVYQELAHGGGAVYISNGVNWTGGGVSILEARPIAHGSTADDNYVEVNQSTMDGVFLDWAGADLTAALGATACGLRINGDGMVTNSTINGDTNGSTNTLQSLVDMNTGRFINNEINALTGDWYTRVFYMNTRCVAMDNVIQRVGGQDMILVYIDFGERNKFNDNWIDIDGDRNLQWIVTESTSHSHMFNNNTFEMTQNAVASSSPIIEFNGDYTTFVGNVVQWPGFVDCVQIDGDYCNIQANTFERTGLGVAGIDDNGFGNITAGNVIN